MALAEIAYTQYGGFSVIAILGITTYSFLLATVLAGYLNGKGKISFDYRIHIVLGTLTLILATVHAIFVLSGKFGW